MALADAYVASSTDYIHFASARHEATGSRVINVLGGTVDEV